MNDREERIEEAFKAHEDAPSWQNDPVLRDAAIRWHMRGFEDALAVFEKAHTPKELWLPVIGFEGSYEVSDQGRVRSLGRIIRNGDSTRRVKGMLLEGSADRGGHLRVHLRSSDARTQVYVHRLVLRSFVGPCPDGMEGCHNDGNPANNSLSNLRWDTQSGNQRDRELHGTNHERNKTHCPRNHPLEAPNLVPWPERQGWRLCLACRRARAHARRTGIPFTQELADQKFAKIAKAGKS